MNDIPYKGFSYDYTQPPHMYVVGTLFGLTPPDFRGARVLEIGCGDGANIMPLAKTYPNSTFVGLDIRENHSDLKNLTFLNQNLLDFKGGEFDYIIAHGFLSWVPENVRAKLFEIIKDSLSENGLAFVSYNTLPGWCSRIREMLLFHTEKFPINEKVKYAREFINFLSETSQGSYKQTIDYEKELISGMDDSHILHDYLADNTQFYFHEVINMAHGLEYIADASISTMYLENTNAKALYSITDPLLLEQYTDFVTNRRFRLSIFGKKKPNRQLRKEQILDYNISINPDVIQSDIATLHTASFNGNIQKVISSENTLIEYGLELALRGFIFLHPKLSNR